MCSIYSNQNSKGFFFKFKKVFRIGIHTIADLLCNQFLIQYDAKLVIDTEPWCVGRTIF